MPTITKVVLKPRTLSNLLQGHWQPWVDIFIQTIYAWEEKIINGVH